MLFGMVTDLKLLSSIKYLKLLESFELYSFCALFSSANLKLGIHGWDGSGQCVTLHKNQTFYMVFNRNFFLNLACIEEISQGVWYGKKENYGWDGVGQYDLFRALEACKRTILRKGSFIIHNPNTDMLMIYRWITINHWPDFYFNAPYCADSII